MKIEPKDNKKEITINTIGRYGESIAATKIDDDKYVVSCLEVGIEDYICDAKEKDELLDKYVKTGVKDFDKDNKSLLMSRALNLGYKLRREYSFFKRHNDDYEKILTSFIIHQILVDSLVLQLNDRQYVDWFIACGGEEDKDYIELMLSFKDLVLKQNR